MGAAKDIVRWQEATPIGGSTGEVLKKVSSDDFDTEWSTITEAQISDLHTHSNKAEIDLVTDGDHDVRTDDPHSTLDHMKIGVFADLVGNQSITGTLATMALDTVIVTDANFTLSSNEVEVNSDGLYLFGYSICWDNTDNTGGTRSTIEASVESDRSGSFVAEYGTYGRDYHREETGGAGVSSPLGAKYLYDGDKVRLRARRSWGTSNIDTCAGKVSLTILKIGL